MAILTINEFKSASRSLSGISSYAPLNESRKFSSATAQTNIFLSHSHIDYQLVLEAKEFFQNLGIRIYVDWADETMPEKTNGTTASKIKTKIIQNDKFVLLATNNAVKSKWCNWEIGFADSYKYSKKKLAILPLADNSGHWEGNEYLQLYPRIERNRTKAGYLSYFIWYPDNTYETLENWLKR